MKNTIKQREDGNYDVSINFDITEHGHSFGMPRNYNLSKVTKLIRSKDVQDIVKNGYGICMYGHGARNKAQGYLANERNHNTGDEQEPIGKVTSLSIKNKIISYDAVIALTAGNKGQSVADMIKAGIGGFSFVWDVPNGVFFGADFVLSPNFNGNRVVMDSICSDGSCQLDTAINDTVLDAIGTHEELFDVAKDLLEHQDNVTEAMEFKGKIKAMQDNVSALENKLEEKDIELDNQRITIEGKDDQIKSIKKANKEDEKVQADAIKEQTAPLEEEIEALKEKEAELKVLQDSITESGLVVDEDGKVQLDSMALGNLFTPTSKDKYPIDEVVLDGLRKPNKQGVDPLNTIEMKY